MCGSVAAIHGLYYDSAGRPKGRPLHSREKARKSRFLGQKTALGMTVLEFRWCRITDERSGAHNFAGGRRGGDGAGAGGGCRFSLGFLVSGGAACGGSWQPAGYGDVAGGTAGFGADCGGHTVCYAGFLSAPGDTAFLWDL